MTANSRPTRREVLTGGGSALNRAKTHCPQGHPYNEENTRTTEGRRYCRACNRDRKRAAKAKSAEAAARKPTSNYCPTCHRLRDLCACGRSLELDPDSDLTFDRAIERARIEGRLDGAYTCRFCGMRAHTRDEAADCCDGLPPILPNRAPALDRRVLEEEDLDFLELALDLPEPEALECGDL